MLCKLFLYSACKNYEAYDLPDFSKYEETEEWKIIISLLLQINPKNRSTPSELYNQTKQSNKKKH